MNAATRYKVEIIVGFVLAMWLMFWMASCAHAETLSDHFKSEEFKCPCCGRVVVDSKLIEKLELLRTFFNGASIMITSGYRCPDHNMKVGGVKNSQHTLGKAADIKVKGYDPVDVAKRARACGFAFVKVYPTWVHVDVRNEER
jgi:hypothetical protein